MGFNEFKKEFDANLEQKFKQVEILFTTNVDKDKLWETYLTSFPKGTNEIFRKRQEFDCSCCRHFIKSFGNVVFLKDNKVSTLWDFEPTDPTFQPVVKALNDLVKKHKIEDVFVTREIIFGTNMTFEASKEPSGKVTTWEHFYTRLPDKFINRNSGTLDSVKGNMRDVRNVFKRSLEEISLDSIETVLELIAQNSLYKGEEHEAILKEFRIHHKAYNKLTKAEKEFYTWENVAKVGGSIGKIRNHVVGTLLTDISQGKELDEAVRMYESKTAPSNYKRPKAIFTQKMLENAQKELEAQGLMDSLGRRFATLDDISVNNVLFANRDSSKRIKGTVFDEMKENVALNPKNFERVEEIEVGKFLSEVLPNVNKLELLLENRHSGNLVSLIAPKSKEAPSLLKWSNGFSWAYSGNITDSMRERVKQAGGKVDGVLRFSIQWNDDGKNDNDFDAHCVEPKGNEICYYNKVNRSTSGMLDVDIINPNSQCPGRPAVENITWSNRSLMEEGTYKFFVNNYNNRGGRTGFTAEIEFEGQIYSFAYEPELKQGENIQVALVTYSRKEGFAIKELLKSSVFSKDAWGLKTNQFHPVSVVMYSPNFWDAVEGLGHRHFFFMLKDCVNPEAPNGFFNEFLKEDLMKHKHVLEALGSKMRVEDVEDQLSGVGFSASKPSSVIVKVEGNVSRILKINF
jgi:hypothetical protein